MGEGSEEAARIAGRAAAFPVVWLTIELALDAWTISQAWRSASLADLPLAIGSYLYGLVAGAAVSLLWGLWVLSLAWSRSAAFPRAFILWQAALIAWIVARQAWAFHVPEFVFTALSFLWPLAEIVIGLIAIAVAADRPVATVFSASGTGRPRGLAIAIFAVLGVVIGAAAGAVGGFLLGGALAYVTDMSCFEGACGYFAVATGLLGMVVCAAVGGIFAVLRARRKAALGTG